jgi:hypothetical protein
LPFAYEFVAGMLEAKFDVKLPTVMEGVKKLGEFLANVPWAKLSKVIIDTIAILVGFRLALGALNLAIAALQAAGILRGVGGLPSLLPGGRSPAAAVAAGPARDAKDLLKRQLRQLSRPHSPCSVEPAQQLSVTKLKLLLLLCHY